MRRFWWFVLLVCALGAGCATLPPLEPRTSSMAFPVGDRPTRLSRAVEPLAAEHPGLCGLLPLAGGMPAFIARSMLIDAAERGLDVQYYIWHADTSGTVLYDALRRAADRGVRVRLLLDDNNTNGLDPLLAALDAHPGIEVRLFNPFVYRRVRWAGYLTDFTRLNRRMHNKSFTADGVATIVGGRNIGDEYFAGGDDVTFADLDVLAIGPIVGEVSAEFDLYWNSASSYPAEKLLKPPPADTLARLAASAAQVRAADLPQAEAGVPLAAEPLATEHRLYAQALRWPSLVSALDAGGLEFEWAKTHLVSDHPAKALGGAGRDRLLLARLEKVLGRPQRTLDLVSPYFVPRKAGTATLREMEARGVEVRILTNALEATDVPAVHAGYAKRREPLLEGGVELWELKRGAPGTDSNLAAALGAALDRPGSRARSAAAIRRAAARAARTTALPQDDDKEQPGDRGLTGSSGASLHAKTFAVDRERVFIGSFNFDPRSVALNTEMGLVIDSPNLAGQIADAFDTVIPEYSYEVRRRRIGTLEWIERRGGEEIIHRGEPGTGTWRRLMVWLLSVLPIEGLL